MSSCAHTVSGQPVLPFRLSSAPPSGGDVVDDEGETEAAPLGEVAEATLPWAAPVGVVGSVSMSLSSCGGKRKE